MKRYIKPKKKKLLAFSAFVRPKTTSNAKERRKERLSFSKARNQFMSECIPMTDEFLKEWNITKVSTVHLKPEEVWDWGSVHDALCHKLGSGKYHFVWPTNRRAMLHMKKIGYLDK